MSKTIVITILGLLSCQCLAWGQPTYFDRLYDADASVNGIWGDMMTTADGYAFVSIAHDSDQDLARAWLVLTDHDGLITETAFCGNEVESFWPKTLLFHRNRYTAVAEYYNSDSLELSGSYALIRWGADMQVESVRLYGTIDRREQAHGGIICSDNGVLLLGQSIDIPETEADMYVVRTDSMGNQLWEHRYGGSNYEGCESAVETPDGGFLILGWTRSYGAGQKDWFLVKTDSLGDQQWQRTDWDVNNQSGSSIVSTQDGNFLLCGGGGNGFARIIKVDIQGNVIWQEDYGHPEGTGSNYLFKVIELVDRSIVACGLTNNSTDSDGGWLVKTGSEGNELWQRKFNKNQHTDLFYSVLAANDGGFLLSGQARNAETFSQDAWLLKVDSVGCAFPNCITGIAEQEGTVLVDVWPNPVVDILNVEMAGSSTQLDIQVMDIQGREVMRHTLQEQRTILDVSGWSSGIYVLKGMDGSGRSFSLKIAKQ